MKMKMCKQCGSYKDIAEFRKYYNRKSGEYSRCTECERINNRYKYLLKKINKGADDSKVATEIASIESAYAKLIKVGLCPPKMYSAAKSDCNPIIPDHIIRLDEKLKELGVNEAIVPYELGRWLVEPLLCNPDTYMDIYDNLNDTYRPFIGTDAEGNAMYDDVFKPVLKAIIDRFYEYEDVFYDVSWPE